MTDESTADALVEVFLAEGVQHFESMGTFVSASCQPDPPGRAIFLAELVFRTDVGDVRIWFGDREREVLTQVKPVGRSWSQTLPRCLVALGMDPAAASNSMWVESRERLREILARHADALAVVLRGLREDPVGVWKRAEEERQRELEEGAAWIKGQEKKAAVARARTAFRGGNLEEVVRLLSRHRDALSEAEHAKLAYAEARLREQG